MICLTVVENFTEIVQLVAFVVSCIHWDCTVSCSQDKISAKKEEITDLIRENTRKLNQLCILTEEKKTLESSLDARQKHVVGSSFIRFTNVFYQLDLYRGQHAIRVVSVELSGCQTETWSQFILYLLHY